MNGRVPWHLDREVKKNGRHPTAFTDDPPGSVAVLDVPEVAPPPAAPEPRPERAPFADRPRRPLKPRWVEHPGDAVAAGRYLANTAAHETFIRGPGHARTVARHAWNGWWRAARNLYHWWMLTELEPVRISAARSGRRQEHGDLYKQRDKGRRRRFAAVAAYTLGVFTTEAVFTVMFVRGLVAFTADVRSFTFNVAALAVFTAGACGLAAIVSTFAVFGRHASTNGRTDEQVARERRQGRFTPDRVVRGFDLGGLKNVTTVGGPRQAGRGRFAHWTITVHLAEGDATRQALAKHDNIASALGVHRDLLFLDRPAAGIEGELEVTVLRNDPMTGPPPKHPLVSAHRPTHNAWTDGLPLGLDVRGRPVDIPILWRNVGIGGRTRVGKTFTILGLSLSASADKGWGVNTMEFKGDDFYGPLRAAGGTHLTFMPGDKAGVRAAIAALEQLEADVGERNRAVGRLSTADNPQGKLTEELARTDARFAPQIWVVDEIQNAIDVDSAFLKVLTGLARTAPSQAVSLVIGMQRAARETLEELRSHLSIRIGLSMEETDDSRMLLGSSHETGRVDASAIPGDQPGVGWLVGHGQPTKVRMYGVDRQVEAYLQRLGRVLPAPPVDAGVVGRLAGLFEAGEWALACSVLAERAGLSTRKLAADLRAAGVEPRIDRTGNVTGNRETLYVHLDQLGGHGS